MLLLLLMTVLVYILKLTINCIFNMVKDCIRRILEISLHEGKLLLFQINNPLKRQIGIGIESVNMRESIPTVKAYPPYIFSLHLLAQDENKNDFMTLFNLIDDDKDDHIVFLKKKTCVHCNGFMFESESHPGSDCDLYKMKNVMFS